MRKTTLICLIDVVSLGCVSAWRVGMLAACLLGSLVTVTGADRPVRLGWIDRFSSGSFSKDQVAAIETHLVGYDPLSCPEQRVVLEQIPPAEISLVARTLRGVCGANVRIPESFDFSGESQLYRGVIFDDRRPGDRSRRTWLDRSRSQNEVDGSVVGSMPLLQSYELPSDVVVCIDGEANWQIGCDWNANLSLEPSECFGIPAGHLDRPIITVSDKVTVVMRGDRVGRERRPRLHILCVNDPRSLPLGGESGQAMIADVVVKLSEHESPPDVEWVLVPTGSGAADIAAAMTAAERADCDAVLVNLDELLHWPTDAARLLSELSRRFKIPVVVTRRTPLSPEYFIEPARASIPDLAETGFPEADPDPDAKPDAVAFAAAIDKLIADLPPLQRLTQADALVGPLTQPIHYVRPSAGEIPTDRFVPIADSEFVVARVPSDAVDGRVAVSQMQAKFYDVAARLYDEQGMRVTGVGHSNGVRFDAMPPTQVIDARGGYVTAGQSLFYRGKSVPTLHGDVRLRWTRGHDIAEATGTASDRGSGKNFAELLDVNADDWQVEQKFTIDRLQQVETERVPPHIRKLVTGLTQRGPEVTSWWYREPPSHGSMAYHHVFQDAFRGPVHWPGSALQFWVVYENGRLLSGYRGVGDAGGAYPGDAWILVQAAITAGMSDASPPKLLQAAAIDERVQGDFEWRLIAPPAPHEERGSQTTATLDRNQLDLPRGDHFLLAELHAQDGEAPGYGWLWADDLRLTSKPPLWLRYYDEDPTQIAVSDKRKQGQTAAQIVAGSPRPNENSDDIAAWRKYLLAIDQAAVRKSHLESVVDTSRRVLDLCRQRLGGLPTPEDPYSHEDSATLGASGRNELDAVDVPVFHVQFDPAWQRTYAWAADAAYRLTRAIGYRELPDVLAEHPISDPAAQDEAYEAALHQLCGLVDIVDPRFVLTLRRYHHRRHESAQAYEILTRYAYEGPATPWYFKKELDAFEQSGVESLIRLGHARWFLHEAGEPICIPLSQNGPGE